jgi:hypothetical protein
MPVIDGFKSGQRCIAAVVALGACTAASAGAQVPSVAALKEACGPPAAFSRVFAQSGASAASGKPTMLTLSAAAVRGEMTVPAAKALQPTSDAKPSPLMYEFNLPAGRSAFAVVSARDKNSFYSLATYRCDGSAARATVNSAGNQALFIQGSSTAGLRGFIEVTLENRDITTAREFDIRLLPADGGSLKGSVPASGHEFLGHFSADDYDNVVKFGRCDTTSPDLCNPTCDSTCRNTARTAIEKLLGFEPPKDEPLVVFVGIAGADRILQLSPRSPGHFHSLGRPRDLWLVYLEDVESAYQNSIDVEFVKRSDVGDFETFDPVGQRPVATVGAEARVVRAGVRRVRVRRPPTDIEVTFTRSGAAYGLRKWQRAYRVEGWRSTSFGAGVFVPANEVEIETTEVAQPGLASGEIANYNVISPRFHPRRVFAIGMLRWTRPREIAHDQTGWRQIAWWFAAPDAVVGVGLPATNSPAIYLGLNWPVIRGAGLTAGVAYLNQSRLLPGFTQGQRLFDLTVRRGDVAKSSLVPVFTAGVTFDVLAFR